MEAFRPGDLILSRSEHDPAGPLTARRVVQTFERVSPVLDLVVEGRIIGTTGEHPFYAKGRGWVPAGALAAGDELLTADGRWLPVTAVRDAGRIATVYNLEVEDDHTYFVGGDGWGWEVWSHNADYVVLPHGQMPAPRLGMESHHGVMSAWVKSRSAAYAADKAPAVLLPGAMHDKTRAIYNTWRAAQKKLQGGGFSWGALSEGKIKALAQKMFSAVDASAKTRAEYWKAYSAMKSKLGF